jgi:hypothetical protein
VKATVQAGFREGRKEQERLRLLVTTAEFSAPADRFPTRRSRTSE